MPRVYKSAQELGITKGEKKALLEFSKWLIKKKPEEVSKLPGDGPFRFVMEDILTSDYANEKFIDLSMELGYHIKPQTREKTLFKECGAVGCIWGGAHLMAMSKNGKSPFGKAKFTPSKRSEALFYLFFPNNINMGEVTPKIAAKTTLHFLKTGEINFERFM